LIDRKLLATHKQYIVSWDVGKKQDPSTLQVYKDTPQVRAFPDESGRPSQVINYMDLVHQDRIIGVNYDDQISKVYSLMHRLDLLDDCQLLIDGTGVGEPVSDFVRARGLFPFEIVFTGGSEAQAVYQDFGTVFGGAGNGALSGIRTLKELHVPKEDLVDAGVLMLQQGRLRCAKGLKYLDVFMDQMQGFKGKVNERTKHVSYGNESDALHDDFVCAYLMAAWWMTYRQPAISEHEIRSEKPEYEHWSAYDDIRGGAL